MNRIEIINHLLERNGYVHYLEIGVQNGVCFRQINTKYKTGVDPDPNSKATLHVTSDEFFSKNITVFDLIFIDGLHESPQPYIDITNALHHLNYKGTVVVHDCLPPNENSQIVPRVAKVWTGDVWKDWVRLRSERSDLDMKVVDTDFGVGIIKFGNQKTVELVNNYSEFEKDKERLLNLISVDEFRELY